MGSLKRICRAGRKGASALIFLLFFLSLGACQPTPEERLSRAEDYFERSEYRATILELKNALQGRPDYPQARFLLGRASYQLADFRAAQFEIEKALSQGLDRPEVWESLGRTLLAQGDATAVLERVEPNLAPSSASEYMLLGNSYLALNNNAQAAEHFAAARAIDEFALAALIGEAVLAAGSNDSKTAEALLDLAKLKHPDSDVVWRAVANYHRSKRELDKAVQAYDKAINLESGATPLADRLMAHVNRVSTLIDSRDIETAASCFEQLSSEFPSHPVIGFLHGRLAYAQGDFDVAQAELREYLADVPNDLRGYALLGAVNFSQNHLQQAETYLEQAARNQVGGDVTARLLAETRLRLNKPGEALKILGGLGIDGSEDPSLLAMYGRAQFGLGNTAAALAYFEKGAAVGDRSISETLSLAAGFFSAGDNERAIEILNTMPEHGDSRFRREALLMAAHLREGDGDAAIAVGEQLLADNPNNAAAFATVGVMHQSLGDNDKARAALVKAVDIDPANRPANFALSRLDLLEGDIAASEQRLISILNAEPAFMPGLVSLASLLLSDDRADELLPRVEAAIDADPESPAPRLLQIRVLLLSDDAESALRAIANAQQAIPDNLRLTHAEGIARFQNGNPQRAMRSLHRAANGDRENSEFQFDLASVGVALNDFSVASEAIARYRNLRQEDYQGLAMQAAIMSQRGRYDAARNEIERYTLQYPSAPSARSLAGDIEMAAGEHARALTQYKAAAEEKWTFAIAVRLTRVKQALDNSDFIAPLRRWVDENPKDAGARRLYGQMLEASGETELAVTQYEYLLATDDDDPVALNNLAWQYAESGKDGAIELAERAHALAPENGSITDTLGWILFQKNQTDRALPLLEEASVLAPDDLEVRFHLAAALAKSGDTQRASVIIAELLDTGRNFSSKSDAEALAQSL